MIGSRATYSDAVPNDRLLHEAPRVFARGKGVWRTMAEVYSYFFVAGLVLPLVRDASFALSFAIAAVCATGFAAVLLVVSLGSIQITQDEVRVRSWRGTAVVRRSHIDEVVHVKDLIVMGTVEGYVALLDRDGRPLWRSVTNYWRPETVKALVGAGRRRSVVGTMPAQEAAQRWPGMLPWSLANATKAFMTTVVLGLVVVTLGLTVLLLVVD